MFLLADSNVTKKANLKPGPSFVPVEARPRAGATAGASASGGSGATTDDFPAYAKAPLIPMGAIDIPAPGYVVNFDSIKACSKNEHVEEGISRAIMQTLLRVPHRFTVQDVSSALLLQMCTIQCQCLARLKIACGAVCEGLRPSSCFEDYLC